MPWLIVAALFVPLRRLERLLHEHLFKVGWLLTKRLRTTTLLYYTFFLPGVVLHEAVAWLVAGFLNEAAERTVAYPDAPDIRQLRLSFLKLRRDIGRFKLAVISTVPFLIGVIAIWLIATRILQLQTVLAVVQAGGLSALPGAIAEFVSTADVFLWIYIAFTIANTMMPRLTDLKGWWLLVGVVGAIGAALFLVGVADEVVLGALAAPLAEGLGLLAWTFGVIIGIDLFMLAVLGVVEAAIERVTGDSATFQNGKLITMTREELRQQREQAQAKRERDQARRAALPSGPPSVYSLPFPIPDAPGRESLTPDVAVRREEPAPLASGEPTAAPATPQLARPSPLRRPEPAPVPAAETINAEPEDEPEQVEIELESEMEDAEEEPIQYVADDTIEPIPDVDAAQDDDGDDPIRYVDAEEPA